MEKIQIDRLDLKILSALQDEGRISFVDLAEAVGLSKTPCLNRVRRLEQAGYIRGYSANLDPGLLDQDYVVFVEVKLSKTTRDVLAAFNQAIREIDEVQSCHMVSGGFDYLLKVRTRDMESYTTLMIETLSDLPGVVNTTTYPAMQEVKDSSQLLVPVG